MSRTATMTPHRALLVQAASLVAVVLIVYLPAFFAGFIWDDDAYLTDNPVVRSPSGLRQIWFQPMSLPQYYPLVFTTFWIEARLWGVQWAFPYHATNILLHACNVLLLWCLLRRLRVPGAWLAATIFAIHPVHVESVAWITERKNVLSTLFFFVALLTYLRFLSDPRPHQESSPRLPQRRSARWVWYALSLVLFLGALFSKTVTSTLPAAVLVILWWQRGRLHWHDAVPLLPFFVLGVTLGLTTAWLERHHVGALGEDWALAPLERILLAGRALWFYAAKLAWPWPLAFIYPRWHISGRELWHYLFPLGATGLFVALWLARRRWGRAPLAAALLFAGMLFPALGFFNIYPMRYSFVADHFQYLASAALIAAGAAAATLLFRRTSRLALRLRSVTCAITLVALAGLSWRQEHIYLDLGALWWDTMQHNPESWIAHNNFAVHIASRGDLELASAHLHHALRIRPRYYETYNNRAAVHLLRGDFQAAIQDCNAALHLKPNDPIAYGNRAVAHFHLGDYERAWADLKICRAGGGKVSEQFLKALRHASGRNE